MKNRTDVPHVIHFDLSETITQDIWDEVGNAEEEFPLWPRDPVYSTAIMSEEAGEAVKAAVDFAWDRGSKEELRKELVQTAAMCIRAIGMLDKGV